MTHVTVDQVFAALRQLGGQATAKQIAHHLNWRETLASSRLGRLAMYRVIDRVPMVRADGHGIHYRYSIKQE